MRVHYPDYAAWLHQMIDIFCRDCYGAGALRGRARVIDAGANIGVFTLFVKWLRPEARVVAVEPGSENLRYLRQNLGDLRDSGVEIVPYALGSSRHKTMMAGVSSDSLRTGLDHGNEVKMIPLSGLITEQTDLLKLDVEGAESDVLKSAGESLKRVKRVVIEHHKYPDRYSGLSQLMQTLEDYGFDRLRVFDHREFICADPGHPEYCCLLESRRAKR